MTGVTLATPTLARSMHPFSAHLTPWGINVPSIRCLWLVSVSITHLLNGREETRETRATAWRPKDFHRQLSVDGWSLNRCLGTLKATTVFIQFSPMSQRFKKFIPEGSARRRQKSKRKIFETFNASDWVYFFLLFFSFLFFFLFFFSFCLRDVQKLNGNQHITSGKICVNKVAGVVGVARVVRGAAPISRQRKSRALRKLRDLRRTGQTWGGRDIKSTFKPLNH